MVDEYLIEGWKENSNFIADDSDIATAQALALIFRFSQIDGSHHKSWVLDQITRILTGKNYDKFVTLYSFGHLDEKDLEDNETLQKCWRILNGQGQDEFDTWEVSQVVDNYYEWSKGAAP